MGAPQIIYIVLVTISILSVLATNNKVIRGVNTTTPFSAIVGFFLMYGLYYWGGFWDNMQYEVYNPLLIPQYTILGLMSFHTLKTIFTYKRKFVRRVNALWTICYVSFSIYMLNAGGFFN